MSSKDPKVAGAASVGAAATGFGAGFVGGVIGIGLVPGLGLMAGAGYAAHKLIGRARKRYSDTRKQRIEGLIEYSEALAALRTRLGEPPSAIENYEWRAELRLKLLLP